MSAMIARRWRGWADRPAAADAYMAHFDEAVRPKLQGTDGFVDATVERVGDDGARIEIVVVTRWTSLDAIRAFAGDELETAVVEPEAQSVLADYDGRVHHIELAEGRPSASGADRGPTRRHTSRGSASFQAIARRSWVGTQG